MIIILVIQGTYPIFKEEYYMFKSLMHVALYCDDIDNIIDFYVNKLGGKLKVYIRYKEYLNRDDRPENQAIARIHPERVFNAYVEIANGQYLELFPKLDAQNNHLEFNKYIGYSHFSLLVDDIFETKELLLKNGVKIDKDISKGPSETYQLWISDPEGNRIEIMQFTEKSYQLVGKIDLQFNYIFDIKIIKNGGFLQFKVDPVSRTLKQELYTTMSFLNLMILALHTVDYLKLVTSPRAKYVVGLGSKEMAYTVLDLLLNPSIIDEAKEEMKLELEKIE